MSCCSSVATCACPISAWEDRRQKDWKSHLALQTFRRRIVFGDVLSLVQSEHCTIEADASRDDLLSPRVERDFDGSNAGAKLDVVVLDEGSIPLSDCDLTGQSLGEVDKEAVVAGDGGSANRANWRCGVSLKGCICASQLSRPRLKDRV